MDKKQQHEPSGLGSHNHGPTAEAAQQQGWGIEEEQRTIPSAKASEASGGTDFDYGPQDFGDNPVNEGGIEPSTGTVDFLLGKEKKPVRQADNVAASDTKK